MHISACSKRCSRNWLRISNWEAMRVGSPPSVARTFILRTNARPCYLVCVSTVVFGDFEWDEYKAKRNLEKHAVTFEEAASVFSDLNYAIVADTTHADRYLAIGYSSLARMLVVVHCERAERVRIISARKATRTEAKRMTDKRNETEPSAESLEEIPEVDFSKAIRPNRYARLQGDFVHQVQLDPDLWSHFGSQEKVIEALRMLVELANKGAA